MSTMSTISIIRNTVSAAVRDVMGLNLREAIIKDIRAGIKKCTEVAPKEGNDFHFTGKDGRMWNIRIERDATGRVIYASCDRVEFSVSEDGHRSIRRDFPVLEVVGWPGVGNGNKKFGVSFDGRCRFEGMPPLNILDLSNAELLKLRSMLACFANEKIEAGHLVLDARLVKEGHIDEAK